MFYRAVLGSKTKQNSFFCYCHVFGLSVKTKQNRIHSSVIVMVSAKSQNRTLFIFPVLLPVTDKTAFSPFFIVLLSIPKQNRTLCDVSPCSLRLQNKTELSPNCFSDVFGLTNKAELSSLFLVLCQLKNKAELAPMFYRAAFESKTKQNSLRCFTVQSTVQKQSRTPFQCVIVMCSA